MQHLLHFNRDSRRQMMQKLNRLLREMNVFRCAVAIGLAGLDFTCFMTLALSTEIKRAEQQRALSAKEPGTKLVSSPADLAFR
jgi:hypothetical protein